MEINMIILDARGVTTKHHGTTLKSIQFMVKVFILTQVKVINFARTKENNLPLNRSTQHSSSLISKR